MNSLDALFSDIDDFCQNFELRWHSHFIDRFPIISSEIQDSLEE